MPYNTKYPSVEDLREKAKKKIPQFAFDYLDGGCNEDVNLWRNTKEIREIQLIPRYLKNNQKPHIKTKLFGETYDAPFGIAPIGLQGLIWPNCTKILAKAAFQHNIPFILSTVATNSIEEISEITEGKAWFQLYYPTKKDILDDIIKRASSHCPVLVLLCDVPTFGFRPRDIRNGLGMPPRMTLKNILSMLKHWHWLSSTMRYGIPKFRSLTPYTPKGLSLKKLGLFMDETFDGKLNKERIQKIRDQWKGKLVLKGIASQEDLDLCLSLGIDAVIVSNHGGRQIDAGQSSINFIKNFAHKYKEKITIMMDSGLRSGPDIARAIACGADFTFLGRSFMYAVAALADKGGDHMSSLLKTQVQQVMEQLCCPTIKDLAQFLAKNSNT